MSDEATSHFVDQVDQMTIGHLWLQAQFGRLTVVPSIGWHIDPFGITQPHRSPRPNNNLTPATRFTLQGTPLERRFSLPKWASTLSNLGDRPKIPTTCFSQRPTEISLSGDLSAA